MSNDCCSGSTKLIFACSGAADVGAIADQAARKLTRDGSGKMFCLAGIGGRISGILKTVESADRILAIDGCSLECTKNSLKQAGYQDFKYIQMADMGMVKGQTPVNEENITRVVQKGAELLA